jgi:hypothetical protein
MRGQVYDFRAFCRGELVSIGGHMRRMDAMVGYLKRNQPAYAAVAYFLAVITLPEASQAASGLGGGSRLIMLMQKAAFWLGMAVSIWGIVEAQLDFPGWRGRILKGVLGYIGVLLVPLVFLELDNSLRVDVWQQIDGGTTSATGGVRP